MDSKSQLQDLKKQLVEKRKKVIHDPDIPSQILAKMISEMNAIYREILQLEKEVNPNDHNAKHIE